MSTIDQICPGCGRRLELPNGTAGRHGKCPACAATFVIGSDTQPDLEDRKDIDQTDIGPVEEADSTDPSPSPPVAAPAIGHAGPVEIVTCQIDDVIESTVKTFKRSYAPAMLAFVICAAACLILIVAPGWILYLLRQRGWRRSTNIGLGLFALVGSGITAALSIGFAKANLAIARTGSAQWDELIPRGRGFRRACLMTVALLLAGVVIGVAVIGLVKIVDTGSSVVLARLIRGIAVVLGSLLAFILLWGTWACFFVCADNKGTAMGAFYAAYAMTQENRLTSFFVALAAVVLGLLGTLTCMIGHLVTAPLSGLLFAHAYLMMTGQLASDPTLTSFQQRASAVTNQRVGEIN